MELYLNLFSDSIFMNNEVFYNTFLLEAIKHIICHDSSTADISALDHDIFFVIIKVQKVQFIEFNNSCMVLVVVCQKAEGNLC